MGTTIAFNALASYLGLSSPTTTKLRGWVKKKNMIVMLDSGATHNFISPPAAKKAHLGTCIAVQGARVCRNVIISLQDIQFKTDYIVLDLGNVDSILGMHWLRTLDKCQID